MKHYGWLILSMLFLWSCAGASRHYDVDRRSFPVKGIDISAHNGHIDFERVKNDSVDFVIIKATEGDDFCDAMFALNYNGATAAGLKVGAYHFFRFRTPGHIQAYHLLSTIEGKAFDLPIAIDVEDWLNDTGNPDMEVTSQLQSMIETMQSNGRQVMIYTNKKGYERYIKGHFQDVPLWICSLTRPPETTWALWQHSHSAHVDGINGPVDINTYNGPASAFNLWSLRTAPLYEEADSASIFSISI